ncbi:lipoprotein [Spiroplasma turonicum]|uniref:Lipoprotein n=1 Tax=Spiroplasma turonicum TaxID=216946 RepID=A0A0K1P5K2_9MOLU|nr:lipoprotein [Spiroplasma turonicum]AKU79459.1 hypothetical protein STURON_00213 [Spiroplasma turonicum]ALX70481.1 hypothetical protein STURO_v1c02120 [Spiroplasma turonicum]
MKKLLTLLSTVSLIATTAQIVVACDSKYDQKDADGNSILVHFLEKLDGKADITAKDVLNKLINASSGVKNREKFSIDLLKMFNLSLVANSENNYGEGSSAKYKLDKTNPYYIYNLENIITERWKTLSSNVDRQIQNEKDKYKNDYAGKWEDEWKKMLVEKFSVYQTDTKDMDRDLLEQKYKADILLNDSSNNVSKTLLDVLLNTDQQGVTWVSKTTVQEKYKNLVAAGDDESKVQSILDSDKNILNQIYNSTKDSKEWVMNKTNDISTWNNLKTTIENTRDLKYDVPVDLTTFSSTDAASRKGFISNSQRFFLDKWYTSQSPLAISEITIPFADEHKFEDGVSWKSFENRTYTKYQAEIGLLLKSVKPSDSSSDNIWRRYMSEGTITNLLDGKATIKKYDKLLTLSNSSDYTQDLRDAVYDYVLRDKSSGVDLSSNEDISKIDDKVIQTFSRNANNVDSKFYAILGDGRLLLIDTSGLHIINIDGYKYLKESSTSKDKSLKTTKSLEDGLISTDTRKELENFKNFHKLTNNEKIAYIQTEVELSNGVKYYDDLNKNITNRYLKYLTNTSLIKGIDGAATSFDAMSEVKDWVKIESSTDVSKYSWSTSVFEYFKTISIDGKNKVSDQKDFINQFIEFKKDESAGDEDIATALENKFNSMLNTVQSIVDSAPSNAFVNEFNKRNEEIKKQSDKSDYPKRIIEGKDLFDDNLKSIANKKFWKPGDKATEDVQAMSLNYLNVEFINIYYKNYSFYRGDK